MRTLIKKIFDPFFISYCLLWCLIHSCRWLHHPIPYLNNWLTDLIFVPVVIHLSLSFTRHLWLKAPNYHYPFRYILFVALYSAIIFEGILPIFSTNATRDITDVFAYFAGSIFYYYFHQRNTFA